jgi:hypothetical protein
VSARTRLTLIALAAVATLGGLVVCAAAAPNANGRYAIEFRARSGGYFGHSYVAYGRVDGSGRLTDARYAGFYPSGILEDTPLLAVLAAPGFVNLKPRDRIMRSDLVYRREIDPRTYARLPYEIQMLRRSHPLWHLTLYNCNNFAGDVAESLGMRVPPTLEMPKDFVAGLYQLNKRTAPGFAFAAAQDAVQTRAAGPDMLFWRDVVDGPPQR